MKKTLLLAAILLALPLSGCAIDAEISNSQSNVTSVSSSQDGDENVYKIKYVDYDGTLLLSLDVKEGEYPRYYGELPSRPDTEEATYVFAGWNPKPTIATCDMTYTATYLETKRGIYIDGLKDEYFPYKENAKNYLEATSINDIEDTSDFKNVHTYMSSGEAYSPISFSWMQNYSNVTSQKFTYSPNEDYSEGKTLELSPEASSVELFNLLKNCTYHAKIEVINSTDTYEEEFTFKTTDLGPRVMRVEGIGNVRDVGGYHTTSNKTTLQNMVFRGTEMNGQHSYQITDKGKATMSEEMGIRLDIDLRNSTELIDKNTNTPITTTPIPGAKVEFISANSYVSAITNSAPMAKVFKLLSEKKNYPVYIHCWGGADRTGTVCFLLNALLGVELKDLINDYEFTSFSQNGERNAKNIDNGSSNSCQFYNMYHKLLELYPDGDLSTKVENYLLDAGLSLDEINNIKAINFGEQVKLQASVKSLYSPSLVDNLTIDVNDLTGLSKVSIDGKEVSYSLGDYQIFVEHNQLNDLVGDTHTVALTYSGIESPITCTFKSINSEIFEVEDLFTISDSSGCVKADKNFSLSNSAIGYGSYVRARIKTETTQNSGFYFMIGSYGVYLRGKQVRPQRMTSSMQPGTSADYGVMGTFDNEKLFNAGNLDIVLGVDVGETEVNITFAILNDDGSIYSSVFYVDSNTSIKYSSGEISSENAKFGFRFASDATLGNGIYAYAHAPKAYVDPTYSSNEFRIYLRGVDENAQLFINNDEFDFTLDGNYMFVSSKDMLKVVPGTARGKVILHGNEYSFSFVREEIVPYCEPTYIYGDFVVTFPGCDLSAIITLNGVVINYSLEGENIIISESVMDGFTFGAIEGEIALNSKVYSFSFTKEKAAISVGSIYTSGDLVINLLGVNDTAELYLGGMKYDYVLDDDFNMVVAEEDLSSLSFGIIGGKVRFKGSDYEFTFTKVEQKSDVVLGNGTLQYIDDEVLSYENAVVDFDLSTTTAASGNGYLVAGIGGYGINFRGGRLRWFATNKTSNFVNSDFDASIATENDAKFSESNFSSATGHIRLSSTVDGTGKVTLTATITISRQVSDSYLPVGTYTFAHTFAANASSVSGSNVHSYFYIDGSKQTSATISKYAVI
ncbi:MAG: tyrosine-protein phosphatase [Bacilli bacterium]|nr:tyrosine-protein phosphatase [Bacilli bacterium]